MSSTLSVATPTPMRLNSWVRVSIDVVGDDRARAWWGPGWAWGFLATPREWRAACDERCAARAARMCRAFRRA